MESLSNWNKRLFPMRFGLERVNCTVDARWYEPAIKSSPSALQNARYNETLNRINSRKWIRYFLKLDFYYSISNGINICNSIRRLCALKERWRTYQKNGRRQMVETYFHKFKMITKISKPYNYNTESIMIKAYLSRWVLLDVFIEIILIVQVFSLVLVLTRRWQ